MSLLLIFIILNVVNVLIQTVKSIVTVKGNKYSASIINALAYGLYTVVVVYMVCELPLYLKAIIIGLANLIGVFVVKFIEEKKRKDKLWKVEVSIPYYCTDELHQCLRKEHISHNFITNIGKYTIFNCYCESKYESELVKKILNNFNAKFFVSESKVL